MALEAGVNSWADLEEANAYFSTRLGAAAWTDLVDSEKEAALVTAYKGLINSGLFLFSNPATDLMKDAQCEQAWFLLQHQTDMDARLGLQVQGVTKADIVGETYDLEKAKGGYIVAPLVEQFLRTIRVDGAALYVGDIARDEEDGSM